MALRSPVEAAPRLLGVSEPRIAPPIPAKSLLREYQAAAKDLGISLMPWQTLAARYMTAVGPKGQWLYGEFAAVAARQNGKTELLLPRILMGLRMGRRMLHTAQNRALPRETFLRIAAIIETLERSDPQLAGPIRYANGQEAIKFANGGRYTLVAPRPAVRGNSVDDVFLDEVREQRDFELIAGLVPTVTASKNPQLLYFSNAGDSESVVLNDLRRRMSEDTSLAYLEWSASPERGLDDRAGWAEANPALGVTIQPETLERNRRSLPAERFETEHLCRWVITMQPRLLNEAAWDRCRGAVEPPVRPVMGISMDGSGTRASAVTAWQQSDGTIAIRLDADVTGSPIAVEILGPDLAKRALKAGVTRVAMDDWTDRTLGSYFRNAVAMNGRAFANASLDFVRAVDGGTLRWAEGAVFAEDLAWTSRKPHESGAWQAVKANEDRPITSILAAIRAVGLASGPRPAVPRVF